MKKLFFSAVFLMAFSSVSFANTIEVEEKDEKQLARATDCCIIYDLAYDLAISEGASSQDATTYANIAYNNCEKSNKSLSAN